MKLSLLIAVVGFLFPSIAHATNNSVFVSQSVPSSMGTGMTYAVSVTFENTGNTAWTHATTALGSQNSPGNTVWGLSSVALGNGDMINQGQSKTFSINVTAPMTAGTYHFQWKMTSSGTPFGALSTDVDVVVSQSNNNTFTSQSVPTTMVAGQSYSVSATFKNTGLSTWDNTANPCHLGSQDPQGNTTWGLSSVALNSGHDKAIDQLQNAVNAQAAKVAKHCSDPSTLNQLAAIAVAAAAAAAGAMATAAGAAAAL